MDYLYFARNKVIATYLRYGVSRRQSSSQWGVAVDEVLDIPSRQVGRTIKVHKYGPRDTASPNPVLINFHGSGFTMPLHGTDEEFCVQIVKQTPYTVLDASYRLAPENPFPAAVHDAEDVVKYVLARPGEYDVSRIAVSGFSAGGALALALSGQLFAKGTFRSILAFYPVTNLSVDPREKVAPDSSGRAIPSYLADFFNDSYCPNRAQRNDPLASPSFIKADNYPANMLMITCAQDSLAPEAEEVAERVKGVPGNHVVARRLELCKHGWDKEPLTSGGEEEKRKEEAYALAVDMLMR